MAAATTADTLEVPEVAVVDEVPPLMVAVAVQVPDAYDELTVMVSELTLELPSKVRGIVTLD